MRRAYYAVAPDPTNYSEVTQVGLRTLNLDRTVHEDPRQAIRILEEDLQATPRLELLGILAEVAFVEAERFSERRFVSDVSRREMTEWYLRSARYAFQYLFDARWTASRNPYSPSFQNVCRIFNVSTGQILRQANGSNQGDIHFESPTDFLLALPDARRTVAISIRSKEWRIEDFDSFRFASDFEVTGLKNRYRRYGLGVPLVAKCRNIHQKPTRYRYCLPELCVPMTAFLTFGKDGVPRMELVDTMECSEVSMGEVSIPLEIDYTTPLAYSFEMTLQKNALDGATLGLLSPDSLLKETEDGRRKLKGIYMPQAYDPNKIPVVMVHGIWSSAMTWMEMYNTLNNLPILREHYQFWFYFYPNGQPFWVSAAQLRDDLAALRHDLDPQRGDTNMDHMVLVGHSMGGLVAILQTIDSKERFWNLITATPAEELPGNVESNTEVARWFHTQPNPSISCVITMGTPFRGSGFANSTTRGLTGIVGRKASGVESNLTRFREENQSCIQNEELLNCLTALDSLQKSCIFWDALMETDPPGWVDYFNVIARLREQDSGSLSDGVVSVESASLPWATQQVYVTSLHREIPNNAEAILAVAQILGQRLEPSTKPQPASQEK